VSPSESALGSHFAGHFSNAPSFFLIHPPLNQIIYFPFCDLSCPCLASSLFKCSLIGKNTQG
jgi:hypothetical protein